MSVQFEFTTVPRILFGAGAVRVVGENSKVFGACALVVTGRNPRRAEQLAADLHSTYPHLSARSIVALFEHHHLTLKKTPPPAGSNV